MRYIKPLVEDDPQWMEYMESKAKPQRVSEVLKQYHFIQDKVDDFSGMRTPIHWDGAPALEVGKVSCSFRALQNVMTTTFF